MNKRKQFFRRNNIGYDVEVVRTGSAVSILARYPYRHVQIVLRIYKSPAEVIMGFDIDACALAYDGQRVWALPRRYAKKKKHNISIYKTYSLIFFFSTKKKT